ncbi:type II secretion system minor pseudopilin GspK [Shewanella sp. NIFS-20-20]|uniref:type II secretion system minor pseudopilin GspK n=1 Tax=Shewanella sp. NIFS-20-20 TaxID=2853806 RepID=UPI001C472B4A|nr:type II secretion system minor pseudopilin GspK [Shewanella sp. NIFS-20-20]MBV7316699.1 type II secretion system minor pseudopilin GspK [Shewanella sp. NIFS-20-20]
MRLKSPRRESGVALLVVLLIVAIIALLATEITSRNQLEVRRTLNLAQYDQAYWYAMSAEQLVKKVLKQDLDDSDGTVHLQQYWALADVVFPAEYGEISGKITDMRSCFNLNALSQKSADTENGVPKMPLPTRQFQALLVALGMDDYSAERLSHNLKDYVDADDVTSPYGAEDAEYEARTMPYRAANNLLQHRSELRAVIGFTQDVYQKLQPYVCAIPGDDRQLLNINTLEQEQAALLAAMFENKISVGEAESILSQRPMSGFEKITDFWEIGSLANLQQDEVMKSSIVVDSQYFFLQAGAKVDNAVFLMDSVLKRQSGNKMAVVARQFGGQK